MFDRARAEALVEALDLDLNRVPHCSMCLFGISYPLRLGDDVEVRRALRFFLPLMWDEGLDESLETVLRRARRARVPGAAAALAEILSRGRKSEVARAAVLRLAKQQAEEAERAYITSQN
jgi:hypothetical protein